MRDNTSLVTAIYDIENNFSQDTEVLKNLFSKADDILELGCGTGRVLIPLLEEEFKVDGLDISQEAIDILKSKLTPEKLTKSKLFVADMSSFEVSGRYNFIFSVFNSFMLLDSFDTQLNCLHAIYKHLKPGGKVILSTANPCLERMTERFSLVKHQKTFKNPFTNNDIEKFEYNHFDLDNQLIHRTFYYDEIAEGVIKRHVNKFTVRYIFKYEFILMLKSAGFEVENIYGNWDLSSVKQSSPSIIIVGVKK